MTEEVTAVEKNELEFRLLNPTEGNFLRHIDWNREEIEAAVQEMMKEYDGVVYTEETMQLAKADRAKLNKLTKAIEDRRKAVKGYVMEPYDAFEKEVKEILNLIKKPVGKIDEQIKDFEAKQKEDKKKKILTVYEENIGDLQTIIPFDRLFDSKWLNVSVSLKKAQDELGEKIETIKRDMETIDGLDSKYKLNAKDVYVQTLDLSKAMAENKRLSDLEEKLEAEKRRKEQEEAERKAREEERRKEEEARNAEQAALRAEQEAKPAEQSAADTEQKAPETQEQQEAQNPKASSAETQPTAEKKYRVRFQAVGTKEQLNKLIEYLKVNGIEYGRI